MMLFYQILLLLASPFLGVWIAVRAFLGRLSGIRERLGFFREHALDTHGPHLWIHAVSLGEVKIAAALAEELRRDIPTLSVFYTTSTKTGGQEALRCATAQDRVLYPPFDFRWICKRFLKHISPKVLLVVETELWPNLFHQTRAAGIPLVIVNGRISNKSWPRYRITKPFWEKVLAMTTHIYASSETDAERFRYLAASPDKVTTGNNLKFRIRPQSSPSKFLESILAHRKSNPECKIIVAGSTMAGEEEILLDVFAKLRQLFPHLWLIVAPRHPERFEEVNQMLKRTGLPVSLRSQWNESSTPPQEPVLLLDSIGELASIYQVCDVAFVGGTLVAAGGHNILEPAAHGKPVIVGPSMENFADIVRRFEQENAGVKVPGTRTSSIVQVDDGNALYTAVHYLLSNPQDAARLGNLAREVVNRNQAPGSELVPNVARMLTR